MSERTLLTKAYENWKCAKQLMPLATDEFYLNYVGYHLQQAVELNIKYQMEISGVVYPKTHDIEQLLILAKKAKANLHIPAYIKDHSDMFSAWESKTRYIVNYILELEKIETALVQVEEFVAETKKKYTPLPSECVKNDGKTEEVVQEHEVIEEDGDYDGYQ